MRGSGGRKNLNHETLFMSHGIRYTDHYIKELCFDKEWCFKGITPDERIPDTNK